MSSTSNQPFEGGKRRQAAVLESGVRTFKRSPATSETLEQGLARKTHAAGSDGLEELAEQEAFLRPGVGMPWASRSDSPEIYAVRD